MRIINEIMESILNNDILMIICIVLAGYIGFKIVNKLLKLVSSILFIVYILVKIGVFF